MKIIKTLGIFFTLIATVTLISAIKAHALEPKTLTKICRRISTAEGTTQCLLAGRDHYLDGYALAACDRYEAVATTIQCIRAIADRQYTREEVEICNEYTDATETNKCFKAVGRYIDDRRGGHGDDHRSARYEAERIMRDIVFNCRSGLYHDKEILRCIEIEIGMTRGDSARRDPNPPGSRPPHIPPPPPMRPPVWQ